MKWMMSLLLAAILQTYAHAQQVTISANNQPLKKITESIEKQTGYQFVWHDDLLAVAKPVTVQLNNVSLQAALKTCFKDQVLEYIIKDKFIIIRAKGAKEENKTVTDETVQGTITDENGLPLAGVSVAIKGSTLGTTTNEKGIFILNNVDAQTAILTITYIGFEQENIAVKGRSNIQLQMKRKFKEADSVVVGFSTGYQKIPKERATGSFAQIDNELINRSVSTNILDRLTGVASSLNFEPRLATKSLRSNVSIRAV
ncbi:MAG: carboxypeptidase-like regulatory domain-containing protein, partial [Chitinophagaceae bacterium]|nr:carboxypeptidase-like regulatory domain-containing protein [Chitinophagaceae bacterium]